VKSASVEDALAKRLPSLHRAADAPSVSCQPLGIPGDPPGTVDLSRSAGRGSNRRHPEFAVRRRTRCARASSFVDEGLRFRRAPVLRCECRVLD
jgi:hypothetical protein